MILTGMAGAEKAGSSLVRWQLILIVVMLCGILTPALAAEVDAVPPAQPQITQVGNTYQVVTPLYRASVNDDGNLHSLIVNGVELLNDRAAGSAGSAFFVEHALALPKITLKDATLSATDGTYTILYEFERTHISLTLRQTSAKSAAYVTFCSTSMAFLEDIGENTALSDMATVPSDHAWTDVKISTAGGEFLELHHGTRTWGSELGCQVWELSNIAPNKEYKLQLIPGVADPPQPSLDQLTILSASFATPDHLVAAEKSTELEVRFENNSNQTISGDVTLRVSPALPAPLPDERKPLTCEPHKIARLTWTLTPKEPDFYTVFCSVNMNGFNKTLMTTFGYDAAAIAPPTVKPANFTEYWNNVVAESKAVEPKLTRLADPEDSTSTVTVYRIGMEADGRTYFGWLNVPKVPGRYPGILFLPGEHVGNISPKHKTPTLPLAACGFVVLSIEPTGQSVEEDFKPLISSVYTHVDDAATFGLRGIMVQYLRALSALAAIPEVDPHRLAVTGVSLGGALALELAALDDRVWAAAPDVPYFCHIEQGDARPEWPYPELHDYLRRHPEQRNAVLQTLRYYDVANFTEQINCPVLISAGINDLYSRPTGIFGVYNRLAGPHDLKLYIADHIGGDRAHWAEKIRWFTRVLGGPSPQPAGTANTAEEHHGAAPTP